MGGRQKRKGGGNYVGALRGKETPNKKEGRGMRGRKGGREGEKSQGGYCLW